MASSNQRILVITPAYNEARSIAKVISGVRTVLADADILVIDDCSSDDTAAVASEAGAAVISHAVNLGYGAALESGYIYAVRNGYGIVLQMDGDGQHLSEELPKILDPVLSGGADLSIGSRYLDGQAKYHTPLARRAGQKLFSALIRLCAGMKITDPTSGFQCLGARTISLYTSGAFSYDIPDADMLILAHYAGLQIEEVPVRMVERSAGISMHSGLKPVYYVMRMFLSIFIVVLGFRRWKRYV